MGRRLPVLTALVSRIPVALLIGASLVTAGLSAELVDADAATADPCLEAQPAISRNGEPVQPVLTDVSRIPIELPRYGIPDECDGTAVVVQRPDGSAATTVQLTEQGGRFDVPAWLGYFSPAPATGIGDWVITKATHAGNEVPTHVPFTVSRGTASSAAYARASCSR